MLDDNGKLYQKYLNKKINAEKEGINFNLTFDEIKQLMINANIVSSDWNIKGYHLARFNDTGEYSFINCRFIPYKENYNEKKISDKCKKAGSINIQKYMQEMRELKINNPEKYELEMKIKNNLTENGKRKEFNKDGSKRKIPKSSRPDEYYLEFLDKIKDIDTTEWGWVTKAADLLQVTHTTIKRHVKEIKNRKLADMSKFNKKSPSK